MTNDNNLSVSRIEERKSLQLPRREASGVSPRRLHHFRCKEQLERPSSWRRNYHYPKYHSFVGSKSNRSNRCYGLRKSLNSFRELRLLDLFLFVSGETVVITFVGRTTSHRCDRIRRWPSPWPNRHSPSSRACRCP